MRQPSLWKRAVARAMAVTGGIAGSSLVVVMAVADAARHRPGPARPHGTPPR